MSAATKHTQRGSYTVQERAAQKEFNCLQAIRAPQVLQLFDAPIEGKNTNA